MRHNRGWGGGAGAFVWILLVVLLLGAAGYGISRYTRWQQETRQVELQGRLNHAAASGNAAEIRSLLRSGAAVNGLSAEGRSALHAAAGLGKEEIVRVLLDAGADPNRHRPGTSTPLCEAVEGGAAGANRGVVERLLQAGADPNGRIPDATEMEAGPQKFRVHEQTALMRAVITRQDESVRLLLKHKADANLTDSDGKTALHWWVIFRRHDRPALALGPLLVRRGADPRKTDRAGKSALDYARELGDRRLRETLEKAVVAHARKTARNARPPAR